MMNYMLATFACLAMLACGDGTTVPTLTVVDLAGSYSGLASGTDAGTPFTSQPVNVTISQSGRTLTGTWATLASSGTLNGTAGREPSPGTFCSSCFSFSLTQTAPCNGIFMGIGNAPSQNNIAIQLTGSYTGTYCGGSVTAQFSVDRI